MAGKSTPLRQDRRYSNDRPPDQRDAFQRDRDRILYTSAFRRLAGKTQVASTGEGHVFHNRLTHTLEVAQIARRLAEKLQAQPDLVNVVGGLDPEVVEAAAYAHDLGTPPFGHIAEEELDQLVMNAGRDVGVADGFGANAQSFRTVAKLAVRHVDVAGLNLTRATSNAILKYPWPRRTSGPRLRKWGAYSTEDEEFAWARELHSASDDGRCAEAELMDWADDIAYSVHDVEDFYRAGLIPLQRLATDGGEIDRFVDGTLARWDRLGITSDTTRTR
jgi:dGTPase